MSHEEQLNFLFVVGDEVYAFAATVKWVSDDREHEERRTRVHMAEGD